MTFVIYLNDLKDEDGGKTEFPVVGLKVRPTKNAAGYWQNVVLGNTGDVRTLHSGAPILTDVEKWAITIWIRHYEGLQ